MRVLMLSSDRTIFESGSNARRRMEAYADAVGTLDIIVFTLARAGLSDVRSGPLSLFPTRSHSRLLYGWDALRMPCTRERFDVITVQDPFEIGLVGLLIAKFRRIPLHVQIHTDLFAP